VTWPAYAGEPAAARPARLDLGGVAIFGLALFIVLTYTQGWVMPVFGEKGERFTAILRVAFLPAYAASFILLATVPLQTFKGFVRQPFLIALIGVVIASVFWSIDPAETSRRAFFLVCTTLGAVTLAARFRWSELAEVSAAAFLIVAVLSLLVSAAVPSIGRMTELFPGAWRGLWPEKNAMGGNMALAFSVLVAAGLLAPQRRWLWWGGAVIALFLVLMSTSKTSLLALVLGGGVIAFIAIVRRGPVVGVMATWAALVGIGLLAAVIALASDALFGLLGKDATLTGRTEIWSAAMRQIEERPWTGFGYQAVWGDTSGWGPFAWIAKDAGFQPQHAHNSWIEQWLGMGVWGLAAFGLYYLQAATLTVISIFRQKGAYLVAPFFAVYTLMSLTESIAVTYNDFRWALLVAFTTKLVLSDRE